MTDAAHVQLKKNDSCESCMHAWELFHPVRVGSKGQSLERGLSLITMEGVL